ncbi:MAG TPA: hypothetical protein VFO77_01825, partial [Actinoplanes sp.]|nr:hypothetical protein [Actinoplanes sp.]
MAGDLDVTERAVLQEWADVAAAGQARRTPGQGALGQDGERVIHRYGRVAIVADRAPGRQPGAQALTADDSRLSELERRGLQALQLRESAQYRDEKAHRPRAEELWDMPDCTSVVPTPDMSGGAARALAQAAGPT